jgi:hypothetical protein
MLDGRREARVHGEVDQRPVVEPGALQVAVLEREAERLDQVQRRAGGGRQARGAAGVVRDLGVHQQDVHG